MELAWLNKIYTCSFVAKAAMLVSCVYILFVFATWNSHENNHPPV